MKILIKQFSLHRSPLGKKALNLQDHLLKVYQHEIYVEKMFNNFQIIEELKI